MTERPVFSILTVLTELIRLDSGEVIHLIQINYRDPRPIYEQIKACFRQLILSGVLQPEEKMPSVRELAVSLAINPNTIQRAYRELEQEGYICSVPGKGSFVADASDSAMARRKELLTQLCEAAEELRRLGVDGDTLAACVRGGDRND